MAYYASKGYSKRTAERKASIRATGSYGGRSVVKRTGGYSRYAAEGKGLSDVGYARWITKRAKEGKGTVVENPMSYLMGMAQLGKPVGWAGKPGYEGSLEESYVKAEAAKAVSGMGLRTVTMGSPPSDILSGFKFGGAGGFGGAAARKGKLEPGEPTGSGVSAGSVVVLGGAAYLIWSLLK